MIVYFQTSILNIQFDDLLISKIMSHIFIGFPFGFWQHLQYKQNGEKSKTTKEKIGPRIFQTGSQISKEISD